MKIVWHNLDYRKPEPGKAVFITDGKVLAVAKRSKDRKDVDGFKGFEWGGVFDPVQWAEIPVGFLADERVEGNKKKPAMGTIERVFRLIFGLILLVLSGALAVWTINFIRNWPWSWR
ncbi:MAG: hypothetical protein KGZ49_06010 [Syntrophaceae bacterium]|nr:hypothetical protein [Syntrophaceae bacterium]